MPREFRGEQRRYRRIEAGYPVTLFCQGETYRVKATNLSLGGVFIATKLPLRAGALALEMDGRFRVLAANFTDEPHKLWLQAPFSQGKARFLDRATGPNAAADSETFRQSPGALVKSGAEGFDLALAPFAVATLDSA